MNPYASFLGNGNATEVIAGTPGRLAALVDTLGAEGVEVPPAAGKWSVREILCHLADTELVFAFRLRQTLAETNHVVQPFDQDLWAKNYRAYDAQAALRLFTAVREWNRSLIATVPADAFGKTLNHPERGDMTFQTLIETMGGHDLNHVAQIESITAMACGKTAATA